MPFGFSVTESPGTNDGHEYLIALSHLLTLVGPCSPSVRQCATELDESVPLKRYLSQITYGFGEDTKTNSVTGISDENIEKYRSIVDGFFKLDQQTRESLTTPIARLNLALKHYSQVEKAIDLGIALESLFLSESSKDSPIALPFRLRGAWLLGKNHEHREALFKKFQDLYDLRSSAVHKGSLGKPKAANSHSERLSEGIDLCICAILKIIDRGAMPTSATWAKLILGG
ncbi:hypothetical protein AB4Y38_39425 [Paraburkholderia sp. EG285A]|uniref:hypothetical protein n=1 Tax=Paraburkholderia sp. EG285A TaxID=3237009 RepID=UPI0034D1F7C8